MSVGSNDLVLSSGTVGNPDPAELLSAAQAGGFKGLVLWPMAYLGHPDIASDMAGFRVRIEDAGLCVWDVDAMIVWAGPGDPGPPYFEEALAEETLRMAEALGANGVNVLVLSQPDVSDDATIETFARVCDRAAEHGLVAHLEFSRSRVPGDLKGAQRVVKEAGRSNAGIMVDAWHVHWGHGDVEDLLGVDGRLVTGIQVCDGPADEPADFAYATRHHRWLPGQGVIPLRRMHEILGEIGSGAPVCVEAFDTERVKQIGAVAFACELADSWRALLSRESTPQS